MAILARFTNFVDFYDFRKVIAATFVGISKIRMVNFEINAFSGDPFWPIKFHQLFYAN